MASSESSSFRSTVNVGCPMGATSSVSRTRGLPLTRAPVSETSRTVAMAWRPSSRMSFLDGPNNPNTPPTLNPGAAGSNLGCVSRGSQARPAGGGGGAQHDWSLPGGPTPPSAMAPPADRPNAGSTPGRRARDAQPPATAGRIVTSEPSATAVSSPSAKRMSSPLT